MGRRQRRWRTCFLSSFWELVGSRRTSLHVFHNMGPLNQRSALTCFNLPCELNILLLLLLLNINYIHKELNYNFLVYPNFFTHWHSQAASALFYVTSKSCWRWECTEALPLSAPMLTRWVVQTALCAPVRCFVAHSISAMTLLTSVVFSPCATRNLTRKMQDNLLDIVRFKYNCKAI